MTAPQDVLRRMIANAPTLTLREDPVSSSYDLLANGEHETILGEEYAHLLALAPVLAQHLADALDLLEEANDVAISLAVQLPLKRRDHGPLLDATRGLLASVERDLTHPELVA